MLNVKRGFTVAVVCLLFILAFASSINLVHAQVYQYEITGPFYLNGNFDGTDTVTCNLLWANYTATQITLTGGSASVYLIGSVQLYQITWNASSTLNYTSLMDLKPLTGSGLVYINIYVPDSSIPFSQYTFEVTDFYGMSNAYLEMSVNNQTSGTSAVAEEVNLASASIPTFVMTQYYTYTLTFICDQGSYSQEFTAENTLSNSLIVLAGAFPPTNVSTPTADVERLNSTLIGISYVDPSNSTTTLTVAITHQSGMLTVDDYSITMSSNAATILWNEADPSISYNVNVTATIGTQTYVWVLVADEAISTNPFLGVFDWLGQNTQTMPHVTTGWPAGMTSAQIAEIAGASIVMLFLCVGSFRSAGACCMLSWIIFGILLYMGWLGVISPWTIPEFAFSGFIGILIMIDEGKQTTREV